MNISGSRPFLLYVVVRACYRKADTCVSRCHGFHCALGTSDGLPGFDGYAFTNYGPKAGLPTRLVTTLQVTRDGIYWYGNPSRIRERLLPCESHLPTSIGGYARC